MISETLSHADLTSWPKSALILFFVFFVLVCLWVWYRGRGSRYTHLANLPLEAEENFSRTELDENGEEDSRDAQ